MQISELHALYLSCTNVNTDTRNLDKDGMFFALKGSSFNANTFAENALELGCKYAVIDEEEFYIDDRTILVKDVLICLQELSMYHRQQLSIPVIGITGSNGKTTTKELLNLVLKEKYNVYATVGNYNNHIGVPLTLLSINKDVEIALVEMGANHAGEIEFLCSLCQPNYGIITNIGKAHLEGFGTFEAIIDTKSALYRYLKKNKGLAFVNEKEELLVELSSKNKRLLYRNHTTIDGKIKPSSSPFLEFDLLLNNEFIQKISTQLIGDYNLNNVLSAMAVGTYFDIDSKNSVSAIENYIPSNNRSQWLQTKKNKLILDAYNANPSSTLLAINNFVSLQVENKWVILGDMLELGESEKIEHQKIIDEANKMDAQIVLVGPIYSSCKIPNGMITFDDTIDCKNYIDQIEVKDKTILIKGSRGLKLESLVDSL